MVNHQSLARCRWLRLLETGLIVTTSGSLSTCLLAQKSLKKEYNELMETTKYGILHHNYQQHNNEFLLEKWNEWAENYDKGNLDDITTEKNEKDLVDTKHCKCMTWDLSHDLKRYMFVCQRNFEIIHVIWSFMTIW